MHEGGEETLEGEPTWSRRDAGERGGTQRRQWKPPRVPHRLTANHSLAFSLSSHPVGFVAGFLSHSLNDFLSST